MGRFTSNFTGAEIDKAIAYRNTPPTQDLVDGIYTFASPLSVTAGTEYRMQFDSENLERNFSNGFNANTGITKMWDFINHVADYSEFMDTPNIDAFPNCYFKPSAANAGKCIIKCYVNETVPIFHDQAIVDYKGVVYEKMGDVFKYYLGDEVGYQIKSKGVYFTFTFDHDGTLYAYGMYHNLI